MSDLSTLPLEEPLPTDPLLPEGEATEPAEGTEPFCTFLEDDGTECEIPPVWELDYPDGEYSHACAIHISELLEDGATVTSIGVQEEAPVEDATLLPTTPVEPEALPEDELV